MLSVLKTKKTFAVNIIAALLITTITTTFSSCKSQNQHLSATQNSSISTTTPTPPSLRLADVSDQGVVLTPDSPSGKFFLDDGGGIREAIINEYNGSYYLFYDGEAPQGTKLWRACLAVSSDLHNWSKLGQRLSCGIDNRANKNLVRDYYSASSPWCFFDNGTWYMFYLGCNAVTDGIPANPYWTNLAKSNSIDGVWQKRNAETGKENHVPFYPKVGTWYDNSASPGQVIINPKWSPGNNNTKKYLMFFSGSNHHSGQELRSIGLARTNSLETTDSYDKNDGQFWEIDEKPIVNEIENIENSSIYYESQNGYYFLFANHIDIPTNSYADAVWVYWTKDLDIWDRNNKAIVLDKTNTKNSWSTGAIGMPSVVKTSNNRLALMYDAVEGPGIGHLNRKIGLAYIPLPLQPPK